MSKQHPTIACCGLDCGLCPRQYAPATSRCPGCAGLDFSTKHPSCSVITCCVKKNGFEVCAQCSEFPCAKFDKRLDATGDSFVTYQKLGQNMTYIRDHGLDTFLEQQSQRMTILKQLLQEFDDGRSKSFYCLAATLLSIPALTGAITEARHLIVEEKAGNKKENAKILRIHLDHEAVKENVVLKLRK
jgi:hypothetical protein